MIWTAIILGFAGSFHCIAMCSPLAMAVTTNSRNALLSRLLYNLGRISTYGLMGTFVASAKLALPLIKYQNVVSIMLGLTLIVAGISHWYPRRIPFITTTLGKVSNFLKQQFSGVLRRKNFGTTFALGSLNGMLPCGLTFVALASCLTLDRPIDGFLFMFLFGVGTLPAMLGFTTFFQWIISKFRLRPTMLMQGMLILSGVFLIARVFLIHLPHVHETNGSLVDIVICGG